LTLLERTIASIEPCDPAWQTKARARLNDLTMPHWALGRLMDLAVELAGMTRSLKPPVGRKTVVTMAADHGVTRQGVSKYPREVTVHMVHNFVAGGAGINAVARAVDARVVVVDMGVDGDLSDLARGGKIIDKKVAPGTQDMTQGPAMTRAQATQALERGIEVAQALADQTDLFGCGDMGIGNTTPAAAIAAVFSGRDAADVTGRGTGVDDKQFQQKVQMIRRALEINHPNPADGLDVLAKVGGLEIGGLAGLMLGAAAQRKPILIDGFPCTAGALVAKALAPHAADYMIASHRSVEQGHRIMQACLGKEPLLDLNLRLGEGTGAALAMKIVEASARVLSEVATFEEASVAKAHA
jgi:nicotinate-nucleotide--dimethylbenzimidazole phosphoribosyltransferase